MKKFLYLFLMTITINANAQIAEGKYNFIEDEYLDDFTVAYAGQGSYSFELNVLKDNRIYFSTTRSIDGSYLLLQSGDYLVKLTPVAKNRYEAKTKLTTMIVTIINDNELELLVPNRVIHVDTVGRMNGGKCVSVFENEKYVFKRSKTKNEDAIPVTETALEKSVKLLGINYGGYKVTDCKIIFEDQTNWSRKKEVQEIKQPDINTFEVLTHNYTDFFLIQSWYHISFPAGYTDYAKDKNHVYFQGEIIENINPDDFKVIDPLHSKTSKNIYFKNTIVPNADIDTFESLNGGYSMDKNNYYQEGVVVEENEDIEMLLSRKSKE